MVDGNGERENGIEPGIEQAFARAETQADAALKAAAHIIGGLRKYRGAARQGKIRELQAAAAALRQSMQTLDQEVDNVATSWEFDEEQYLQAGAFARVDRAGRSGRGAHLGTRQPALLLPGPHPRGCPATAP